MLAWVTATRSVGAYKYLLRRDKHISRFHLCKSRGGRDLGKG